MKNIRLSAVLLLLAAPSLFAQQEEKDIPGAKDHPLFTRLSGFVITKYEEKDFDRAEMPVAADDPKWLIWKELEGKVTRITYRAKKDVKVTELQVARNYLNAAKNAGGEIVFDGDGRNWTYRTREYFTATSGKMFDVTVKFKRGGREAWAHIKTRALIGMPLEYFLTVVELEEMKQEVVASSEILDALNKTGRVALYINFDVGKDIIKPESQPIIDEVVKLLRENPSLKLSIEGHTDDTGTPEGNQRLSEMRAKAVMNALVSRGIDAKRLSAVGYGRTKPIADNATEEGRAKNRRVELVKK